MAVPTFEAAAAPATTFDVSVDAEDEEEEPLDEPLPDLPDLPEPPELDSLELELLLPPDGPDPLPGL